MIYRCPYTMLDLDAYLRRIRYSGEPRPDAQGLAALHFAHATRIPFENLDILLGRPVRLDLDSLQAKMVAAERGGYCFEQNLLFTAALERIGFPVTALAARVRYRARRVNPRTHMLLLVRCEGSEWIADVGFGLEGLLLPLPFIEGRETAQHGRTHRIVREEGQWVLQMQSSGAWTDLYTFSLEPQLPVDYEMANFYTSTHPDSPFVRNLIVQSLSPESRRFLRNRELKVDDSRSVLQRTIESDDELLGVLAEVFALRFPGGTRFPFRES
jgi:N-hydroxyarylamine O-acetyltransferase